MAIETVTLLAGPDKQDRQDLECKPNEIAKSVKQESSHEDHEPKDSEHNDVTTSPPSVTEQAAITTSEKSDGESQLEGKLDKLAETLNGMSTAQKLQRGKPMEPFVHTIPKIRECSTMNEFKNHHSSDEHSHAIETLVAGASLGHEMDESVQPGSVPNYVRPSRLIMDEDADEAWLRYVRINSKTVMAHLGRQTQGGKRFRGSPHVFMRPFRYLIHVQDKMKEALAEMEANYEKAKPDPSVQTTSENPDPSLCQDATADSSGTVSLSADSDSLNEMRLYVQFVEERVLPDYRRFQNADDMPSKIRWDDLWYLFQSGDMVHVPSLDSLVRAHDPKDFSEMFQALLGASGSSPQGSLLNAQAARKSDANQALWKVYQPPYRDNYGVIEGCTCPRCTRIALGLNVGLYYIDYDGQQFRMIGKSISIPRFEGERAITELPLYPIRYLKDGEVVVAAAQDDGQRFIQLLDIKNRYAFHRGRTFITTPIGDLVSDKHGKPQLSPDFIESEIIIDFEEAFNNDQALRPEPLLLNESTHTMMIGSNGVTPLKEWTDEKRTQLKELWKEKLVTDDGIDKCQINDFIKSNTVFSRKRGADAGDITGNDLALLPRRMLAYALWERRFVQVDVRDVQFRENKDKDNALEMLQIPVDHKMQIQSLMYTHFMRRSQGHGISSSLATQDLIRGKGKGIVVLLFGVPGVGKTATAEAMAQKFEKPLFPITCGDLGFTPTSVERSLTEIFRLAHLWDCVLLLDEADVFITQRDRKDLERNALVSVFLRMLEYYNGLLFLTTNRPGALDEAIKSRVHLNLQYDYLDEGQIIGIFQNNIQRLKEIEEQAAITPTHNKLYVHEEDILNFARAHFRNHTNSTGRWNGRQIRNAFVIASSLAHYEGDMGEKREGLQKQLTSRHFQKVEETTARYDRYRSKCLGHTDSEQAFDRHERDDDVDKHYVLGGSTYEQDRVVGEAPGPGYLPRQPSSPWQQQNPPYGRSGQIGNWR